MISAELRKQIKALQLKAGHDVTSILSGEYSSAFKGRGMEFDEVRDYFPGDDVRAIDWNVTARMGAPFIKVFREEREMCLMLMLDVSRSQYFGSENRAKVEVAAELAAVLAFLAIRNQDQVGVILFSDRVEQYIPPKKGRSHVWNIIRAVLTHEPQGVSTNMDEALAYFLKTAKRRSLCFLISDFLVDGIDRPLSQVALRHELVCLRVEDPRERQWPAAGLVALRDSESGRQRLVNTSSKKVQEAVKLANEESRSRLKALSRKTGFELLNVATGDSVAHSLAEVFRQKERRRRFR